MFLTLTVHGIEGYCKASVCVHGVQDMLCMHMHTRYIYTIGEGYAL